MADVNELLQQMKKEFRNSVNNDKELSTIRNRIQNGGTYKDAEDYAYRSGQLLSQALKNNITSKEDVNGVAIVSMMEENHKIVSNATGRVQQHLNEEANLGVNAIRSTFNSEKAYDLVNKINDYDDFEEAEWLFGDPIVNNSQGIVDDTLEENVDFQYESGLRPTVTRIAESDCCQWCADLEGSYSYPDVPDEVWQRHDNCRCEITYDPGDGRKQDVYSKKWINITDRNERVAFSRLNNPVSGDNVGTKLRLEQKGKFEDYKKNSDELQSMVKDGKITTTINKEMQSSHMKETKIGNNSYFDISFEDLQSIVSDLSLEGTVYVKQEGMQYKKIISVNQNIGYNVNRNTGEEEATNRMTIHYSKNRTHAVPTRKEKEDD